MFRENLNDVTMKTGGQPQNESQKAVSIDVIKSVGEIVSKIGPVVKFIISMLDNLILTLSSSTLESLNAPD